ncbi:MAG: Glycosyl transferase, family 39 [Microgenomates group bacterium GW2011_GWC1_37_8]|uniref:Glycosyl transferase, family 39 n=1 Tax=Candidatus Woesebacteria bacterium GW2011_GWB1_38_8 TaxID=1618570 RepID=A0A0G0LE71_9BACT|nr:MAG: Glycosyl transferase, family 39 [Microgenomates group bacterium GW2011_GWC1_37_8]KKQ86225.1 MAG: Glycosyl transferase, family 39 [Candidatus Woesebacteria bacterium GW2011_GWB1_38_8]
MIKFINPSMTKKILHKWFTDLKIDFKKHTAFYLLLTTILLLAFFLRVYRTQDLLGFYYDQGRDALRIWEFIHEGKPFLIGPVTGLEGIFLGPLFYYLITPFYFIGQGSPVYPAVFLAFLATCANFVVFLLGKKFHSIQTGLIAVLITSFSLYITTSARWLSNPTPILLTSVLLLYSMYKIAVEKDKRWWLGVALFTSISLQFESASAVFYLPIIFIFTLLQRKHLPDKKIITISILIFVLSVLPQVIFNLRHENIILNNFRRLFFESHSFRVDFWTVFQIRMKYFWTVFSSKIFPQGGWYMYLFPLISVIAIIVKVKELIKAKVLPLLLLFLIVPVVGYLAFQGNYGNIYDYYLTGYYLPMILLFSLGLGILWKNLLGKIIVVVFFILFLNQNLPSLKNFLTAGVDGPTHITMGNQLQGVDWILNKAKGENKEFNLEVYVPPVIPHSYDYLFLWQGNKICGTNLCGVVKEIQRPTIYVLFEEDPPHPERLTAWIENVNNVSIVIEEQRFGGITVQKRIRI